MSLGPKVIVTPFGGHGTVVLIKWFQSKGMFVCYRPDYIFSEGIDPYELDKRPKKGQVILHQGNKTRQMKVDTEWYLRTRQNLNYYTSIRSNLLSAFHRQKGKIVLFGKCSLTEPFLTDNEIEALCMVRHPLYAYNSFLGRRHPQWGEEAGGINTMECARWFSDKWKAVVDDFISSGNPIVHYETLIGDLDQLGYTKLARTLEPIWKPRHEDLQVTDEDVIDHLNELDLYHRGERWELGY